MKKLRLLTLSVIMISAIVFAGCEDDDRHEKELNKKIDRLEREIDSLKEKSSDNSDDKGNTGKSDNAATDESTEQSVNTQETSISGNDTEDTIESLTRAVDEVTKKADSAVPSGNTDEKRTQFFELKDELDIVDHRLDTYDDYIENLYKRGEISYDDYKSQERQLEELEDKLDASEDKLEFNFGIDD